MNNCHTPNLAHNKPSQPHEHSLLVTTIKPKLQTNTAQQIPLTSPREKREMKLSALQQSYMDHRNNFMQCGSTARDRGRKPMATLGFFLGGSTMIEQEICHGCK